MIDTGNGARQAFLHQVIREIDVARKITGIPPEPRNFPFYARYDVVHVPRRTVLFRRRTTLPVRVGRSRVPPRIAYTITTPYGAR